MKNLRLLYDLTIANLKMFIRDKSALFWSLFFPFVIISIFGVLDFANMGSSEIGLVYNEDTKIYAEQVQSIFEENENYKFNVGSLEDEQDALENDDRLLVLEFLTDQETNKIVVNSYIGKENEQSGEVFTLITEKILSDISLQMQHIELPFEVNRRIVNTNDLRFIDYMIPGIIGLSLMQGALFGVIGAIVVNREKGVLKRIFATPLSKSTFLISNIISRTIISLGQIAVLLIFSVVIFDIQMVGSIWLVAVTSVLGSLTFLALGILFSSFAKTAEAARAMIMPVQMLMMFTSGVYFERSVLPKWLYDISGYLPLTYLADTLRDIMVKGHNLLNSNVQMGYLALSIWLVALVILSVRTFRWEIE